MLIKTKEWKTAKQIGRLRQYLRDYAYPSIGELYVRDIERENLIYPEMPEPLKQMFGTADTEGLIREMFTKIEERNYPNLSFTGEVLDEETHSSIIGRLLSKGLREIFAKKPS